MPCSRPKKNLLPKMENPIFESPFAMQAARSVSRSGETPLGQPSAAKNGTSANSSKSVPNTRGTNYGPQLEIRKIRVVNKKDKAEGFDPTMCLPASRFDPEGNGRLACKGRITEWGPKIPQTRPNSVQADCLKQKMAEKPGVAPGWLEKFPATTGRA